MSVCIVLAHGDSSSLSSQVFLELNAVLESKGVEVLKQNLYKDEFDPVLPLDELKRRMSLDPLVSRYSIELGLSDRVIIIHPDWWSGPPAILKGWVDRLFRPGTAYDEVRDFPGDEAEFIPLLSGKRVDVVVLSHRDVSSESLQKFWQDDVFGWCGVVDFELHHLSGIGAKEAGEIGAWKRSLVRKLSGVS
ncbi:flavodoxin family protein [Oceanispirochaeta crateris]|uniref:Flavodoxin family protein n=1 Tax=Oceanispirochaeta crateris TaxID=2518645 RepID=A0A5C1QQG4_9SPIO|nr:NAD(P)H-dependent oxidoreductase [Oceanispirochaeta crateris]QEN08826.1 flavodoxin family protein [Oceanispirochaeta crateris]